MSASVEIVPPLADRIRRTMVGLKMPCAIEILDATMRRLERGEMSALEAIDALLSEETLSAGESPASRPLWSWRGSPPSRRSPASTSPSSRRSTETASWRWPSSSSSIVLKYST